MVSSTAQGPPQVCGIGDAAPPANAKNPYYIYQVKYTWDDVKAETNVADHEGVTFEEAKRALETDPFAVVELDLDQIEERMRVLVWSEVGRVLFVVTLDLTDTESKIISARKAEAPEEAKYHANKKARFGKIDDEFRNRKVRDRKRSRRTRKRS
jgi:uncharacterized DUF497 family protein